MVARRLVTMYHFPLSVGERDDIKVGLDALAARAEQFEIQHERGGRIDASLARLLHWRASAFHRQ